MELKKINAAFDDNEDNKNNKKPFQAGHVSLCVDWGLTGHESLGGQFNYSLGTRELIRY